MLKETTKEYLIQMRTLHAPSIKNWLDSVWFSRDVCQEQTNRERRAKYEAKKGGFPLRVENKGVIDCVDMVKAWNMATANLKIKGME